MGDEDIYFPPDLLKDMAEAARKTGQSLDDLVSMVTRFTRVVLKYARAPQGKFRVICLDHITKGKQVVFGDFDFPEQALEEAERLTNITREAYQVHDDQGRYLGGDYTDEECDFI